MKFKKNKSLDDARTLEVKDKEDDTLRLTAFSRKEKGCYDLIVTINTDGVVGLSRSKALKLAWSIINELDPA